MKSKTKKIIIFLLIPIVFVMQFYLFKFGVLSPQIKGIEVKAISGKYLKDLDKYIIKLDESVVFSMGEYIKIPTYAKNPTVEFRNLDKDSILTIEDNSNNIKSTAKITGNKTGLASVAVVSNDRIIKKFNILVVDPKVKTLDVEIDKALKYVGDSASISSFVEVDFDRFNEKYQVDYKSSNENIIKVIEDKIYAVGVGKATVTAFIDSKKQIFDYNIVARLKNIVADNIDIEIDESKKISADVITYPKNLKTPKLKYSFAETKLPVDRKISLNEDGNITGIREGTEKLLLSCGSGENKVTKSILVTVKEASIDDKKVENFDVKYYFDENNKLVLDLKWDLIRGAKTYKLYMKDNYNESEYNLVEVIDSQKLEKDDNNVRYVLRLNQNNSSDFNYDMYIVGYNNRQNSQKSDIYNLKYIKNE